MDEPAMLVSNNSYTLPERITSFQRTLYNEPMEQVFIRLLLQVLGIHELNEIFDNSFTTICVYEKEIPICKTVSMKSILATLLNTITLSSPQQDLDVASQEMSLINRIITDIYDMQGQEKVEISTSLHKYIVYLKDQDLMIITEFEINQKELSLLMIEFEIFEIRTDLSLGISNIEVI